MRRSTIFLPDINVWLALASDRHVHSRKCTAWLNSIEGGSLLFCRATQMGLLRLLTNKSVMGDDVLSSRDAWQTYDAILQDERVAFTVEPVGLEPEWRRFTLHDHPAPKVWTDAYLSAFAEAGGM
ncbi:MAG: hypothetical protein JO217_14015, partial [Acidobacteriaceae bacterium]|nr:hypothetical protein [Acidobacteriaceae bacterium]